MKINLSSKTARAALAPRSAPYWTAIRKGLYLGFRRLEEGDGTWIGRQLTPGTKTYVHRSFGSLAGHTEAMKALADWATGVDMGATHRAVTVEAACAEYVVYQDGHVSKANAADARARFSRLIDGKPIGRLQLDKLRTSHIDAWMLAQVDDDEDGDEEDERRSRDSANRNWSSLRAALNMAYRNKLIGTKAGWENVRPFPKAGRRRELFLDLEQRNKLIARCDPPLAALCTAMLLTAARPGELAALNVRDFDRKQGTLRLTGKTGTREVSASSAAVAFFTEQAKGKLPAAPLLLDSFGHRWNKDGWKKTIKTAITAAGLPPETVLYTLRHCAITEMITAGVDVFTVARLAGTSSEMIDKHYGHLRHTATRERLDLVQMT